MSSSDSFEGILSFWLVGGKYAEWRLGSQPSVRLASAGQRPKLFLPVSSLSTQVWGQQRPV